MAMFDHQYVNTLTFLVVKWGKYKVNEPVMKWNIEVKTSKLFVRFITGSLSRPSLSD